VPYRLLDRFRSLFDGARYLHRNSSLGDSVALCLPEDLYALHRSATFDARIERKQRVVNVQNRLRGINARRGDGTFGEIIPHMAPMDEPGFAVSRGPVATVEIGSEVKILAKAMIKQIDRVMTDLRNQTREFQTAGGQPITVGIVGINHAPTYVSYEGDKVWPTGVAGHPHPIAEAAKAEQRLLDGVAPDFDEFLFLRFRAINEPPYPFEWVDEQRTRQDYGAVLIRVLRKYEARFQSNAT
jgi:hypothetical protein